MNNPQPGEGIERDPARAGGSPVIAGTRFTVGQLLSELASGMTVATFADEFDIDAETVRAALYQLAAEMNSVPPVETPPSGETVKVRAAVAYDGWQAAVAGYHLGGDDDKGLMQNAIDKNGGGVVIAFIEATIPLPAVPVVAARVIETQDGKGE